MQVSPETQPAPSSAGSRRSNLGTVVAVALLASAAGDIVHELLGHGTLSHVLKLHSFLISTVAFETVGFQTAAQSRLLSAAGSAANIIGGAIALELFRRSRGFTPGRYFLWPFGFLNLMNGTGYLMASAILRSGDWAVVIAGLSHPWAWRVGMGCIGLLLFTAVVRIASRLMVASINKGEIGLRDISRLTVPAYLAGGALLVFASIFNPVSPMLILTSGAGASFGLTFGLLFVPGIAEKNAVSPSAAAAVLPLSRSWVIAAVLMTVFFVAVLGPGIRLD
jgi:hypothetical protein